MPVTHFSEKGIEGMLGDLLGDSNLKLSLKEGGGVSFEGIASDSLVVLPHALVVRPEAFSHWRIVAWMERGASA